MDNSAEPRIVGVRFHDVGKLYHFDSSAHPDVVLGDFVIVETSRGRQLGQIMGFIPPARAEGGSLKPIKRLATPRDLLMKKLFEGKEIEALIACRETAAALGNLEGVKFIKAQYNYDGSVLAFMYTAEEAVNTNQLRKKLANEYRARVEMRRIGARDAAKLLGEYGACGEPRCCSTFLTDFSPISIKMAKAQGISLNPSEITGMCGRLRCCLLYEYEQYVEARKGMPKVNKIVGTPHGEGKVIDLNPLADTVTVYVQGNRHEVHRDEIIPLEELRALQAKAGQGCSKEGGGVCDCGARVRPGKSADSESTASAPQEEESAPHKKRRGHRGKGKRSPRPKKRSQ